MLLPIMNRISVQSARGVYFTEVRTSISAGPLSPSQRMWFVVEASGKTLSGCALAHPLHAPRRTKLPKALAATGTLKPHGLHEHH